MTTGEVIALIKAFGSGGGGGGGVLVVNLTESEVNGTTVLTCDKTAGEMAAALEAGGLVMRFDLDGAPLYRFLLTAMIVEGEMYSFALPEGMPGPFTAASASDYPSTVVEGGINDIS